jgi:hypothetical protein
MTVTDPVDDQASHRFRCYLVEGRLCYDDYFPPEEA